jgi:hypothetical protein
MRSQPFWLLTAAFFVATATGIAMTIHAIPICSSAATAPRSPPLRSASSALADPRPARLRAAGRPPTAQTHASRRLRADRARHSRFLDTVSGSALVIAGLVLLGMGNGMTTLARATVIADRYGSAAYGAIAGVAAFATTAARAVGPVAAAAYAAATGYPTRAVDPGALTVVAGVLAYRSERA